MKPKRPFDRPWLGKWRDPAVIARFTKMWMDDALLCEIGDAFGLANLSAISARARSLGLERRQQRRMPYRKATTTPRKCLGCGRDFPSEGFGHRRCDPCKRLETEHGGFEEHSLPAGMPAGGL